MTVVSKSASPNNYGTSISSSSSATTMPLLLGGEEVLSPAPLLLSNVTAKPQENYGICLL
jgi:hypothetical protein